MIWSSTCATHRWGKQVNEIKTTAQRGHWMLLQNVCAIFFFIDATASVKRDNKSLLTKKYLKLVQISLVCCHDPHKNKTEKNSKTKMMNYFNLFSELGKKYFFKLYGCPPSPMANLYFKMFGSFHCFVLITVSASSKTQNKFGPRFFWSYTNAQNFSWLGDILVTTVV